MMAIHDFPIEDFDVSDAQVLCSPTGNELKRLGSSGEVLTRVDLDLAYSTEKLLNLNILLLHVEAKASHYEALVIENEDISADSVEKALEFDILSGILDSEVKELDNFMFSLQDEILDARERISLCEHVGETLIEVEGKLHDSEETLMKLQHQVSDMRMQSTKFESTIAFAGEDYWNSGVRVFPEISQFSSMNTKVKMQTAEQQRHVLKMLEKSLARELDLEKWLSETRHNEEELKFKLHYMEETVDVDLEHFFEVEVTSEVLMGIAKEKMGELQIVQLSLSGSRQREESALEKLKASGVEIDNLTSKLKEAEKKCNLADSDREALKERVILLEGQLIESCNQLCDAKVSIQTGLEQRNKLESEISDLVNIIKNLRAELSKEKGRADSAEAKYFEITEEISSLKSLNLTEKVNSLEKQLRQSDTQLQHAKASFEASQEQQNMLDSAFNDMESLIEDLKMKALKAENRVEGAEAKCVQLTETNLELSKEVVFLKGRIEYLEASLHQANNVKIATAKDIGTRTKAIISLVMQLAIERERLQRQISSLMKENHTLVKKLKKGNDGPFDILSERSENGKESVLFKHGSTTSQCSKSIEVTEPSTVDKSMKDIPTCETEVGPAIPDADAADMGSELETARTIDAEQYKLKSVLVALLVVFMAVLVVLISVLAGQLSEQENSPF